MEATPHLTIVIPEMVFRDWSTATNLFAVYRGESDIETRKGKSEKNKCRRLLALIYLSVIKLFRDHDDGIFGLSHPLCLVVKV